MWLEIAQSHNLLLQQRFAFYVGWCYMIPTYYGYFFASFTYQICQRSQSTNERIHGSAEFVEKCFASVSGGCCGGGCRYCPLIISYIQLCHLPNCTPPLSLPLSLCMFTPSIFTHCNRDWYFSSNIWYWYLHSNTNTVTLRAFICCRSLYRSDFGCRFCD